MISMMTMKSSETSGQQSESAFPKPSHMSRRGRRHQEGLHVSILGMMMMLDIMTMMIIV